jgi:hypothetical protein
MQPFLILVSVYLVKLMTGPRFSSLVPLLGRKNNSKKSNLSLLYEPLGLVIKYYYLLYGFRIIRSFLCYSRTNFPLYLKEGNVFKVDSRTSLASM